MTQRVVDEWARARVPHGKGSGGPFVSCSIGVTSLIPKGEFGLDTPIGIADEALYLAKANGRNRFEVFDMPEQAARAVELPGAGDDAHALAR